MDFLSTPYVLNIADYSLSVSILSLLIRFILPTAAMFTAYWALLFGLRKILSLIKKLDDVIKHKILKWTRLVFRLALIIGIMGALGGVLGISAFKYINDFLKFLRTPFFVSGNTSLSIVTIILVIPIFYLASWSGRLIQSILEKSILPELTGLDESRKLSIGNVSRFITLILVLLFMLSMIGIDLTALGVLLGALGIGVGFGLQDLVANFFAGITILFARQIKMQDRILVNDYEGIVTDIKLMTTTVTTLKNENIIIPNSQIINKIMHNYSYNNREVMLVNSIGVHYQTDLDQALDVLYKIGEKNVWKIRGAEIRSFIRSFDDSGITLELWVPINDVSHRVLAFAWTNLEIWRSFKENGIEIPYPQMDVHIKSQAKPVKMDVMIEEEEKKLES
jgi:potassium efflux system protein